MSSTRLNDWLQIVAMFALVGSLIFVGLQMRQAQEIALSQAYQARADQSIGITLAALESDTTQSLHVKWIEDPNAELAPAEYAISSMFASARLIHWDTQLAGMRSEMRHPEYRESYGRDKD